MRIWENKKSGGQGLIEYIILVALIAVVSIAATRKLGNTVKEKLTRIEQELSAN